MELSLIEIGIPRYDIIQVSTDKGLKYVELSKDAGYLDYNKIVVPENVPQDINAEVFLDFFHKILSVLNSAVCINAMPIMIY